MKENLEGKQGITLIALVITIIVLLILAGVSIAMLTGENGILTQAQNAGEQTDIGEEKEQIALAYNGAKLKNDGKEVIDSDLDEQFKINKTNADAEGNNPIVVTFDTGRKYEINDNGSITGPVTENETPGPPIASWNEEKGVNSPALGENMELVSYNEDTKTWKTDNSDSSYDYMAKEEAGDNTESRWANARVTIDGVESYFVWIPRYAYKIEYADKNDIRKGGTIKIKFLKETSNIAADGTVCKYADDVTLNKDTDYIIHPAFTSNLDLGGWRTEVTGIWVGKYETARSDSEGATEGGSRIMKIQPGVTSRISTTVGEKYDDAKVYSTNLNSHMIKNSEWGAVAYLTHSSYGRNGTEIGVNANEDYITANGDIEANANQSSTGNITGVYDLSGGTFECVAAYYSGSTSPLLTNNGSQLVNETNREFVTAYTGTTVSTDYKLGDATYETSGWNGDDTHFVNEGDGPFFGRSGNVNFSDISEAGIFGYSGVTGNGGRFSHSRFPYVSYSKIET